MGLCCDQNDLNPAESGWISLHVTAVIGVFTFTPPAENKPMLWRFNLVETFLTVSKQQARKGIREQLFKVIREREDVSLDKWKVDLLKLDQSQNDSFGQNSDFLFDMMYF